MRRIGIGTQKAREGNRVYRKKFFVGLGFSIPLVYFMLADFISFIPFREAVLSSMGFISLLLAIPVQFILAWDSTGGWSSLRMKTFNMDSLIATVLARRSSQPFEFVRYVVRTVRFLPHGR